MNLNMNLNTNLGALVQPLLRRVGLIISLGLIGVIAFTVYFVSNLFFAPTDLDALSSYQETGQTKQIKFNQTTLESLDKLVPAGTVPAQDTTGGRTNPFAPL